MTQPSRVRALGEIALRVTDLDRMQQFYQEVIGLRLMRRFPQAAFFKIADGFEGHTQILALFDRAGTPGYSGLDRQRTTVDHIAFAVSRSDFEDERQRLARQGLEVSLSEHAWVHWRSLYVSDPEGNRVEFVCFDPDVV